MKICVQCKATARDDELYCPNCGSLLKETMNPDVSREKHKKKIGIWILIAVLAGTTVLFGAIAVYQFTRADEYLNKYYDCKFEINYELTPAISDLQEQNAALSEQTEWMDNYIAIINVDEEDDVYHTYTCSEMDWDGDWGVYIYGRSEAEGLGYLPCPICHPNASDAGN